jgi:hypothetical protein
MAAGDAVAAISSIANNSSLTIQPGSGVEWCIHNISTGSGNAELYMTDGSNTSKVDTSTGWAGYAWFLTNSVYLTVKNVSGGTLYFGYTGVVTK